MTQEELNQLMQNGLNKVKNNPDYIKAKQYYEVEARNAIKNAQIEPLQDFATIMNEAKKAAAKLQVNGLSKTKLEEQQLEKELVDSIRQKLVGEYELSHDE